MVSVHSVVSRRLVPLLLILLVAGGLPLPTAQAEPSAAENVRWIVGVEPYPAGIMRGDTWQGGTVIRADPTTGFLVVMSDIAFPERVDDRDDVRYVERDIEMFLTYTPNDSRWSSQYGPKNVRANVAWDITMGTTDKVLCVVDTGLRTGHEDLAGPRYLGGYDIADGDSNVADPHGHGTHVTGIAAATTDNAKGIAGIAQVPFKVAKVIESATGSIWQSDAAAGIRWCADNGGHVINISLGSLSTSSTLGNAISYAYNAGVLILAATGNDGCNDCVYYPAKYSQVVAVGCTDSSNNRCSFSNGGPEVELAAPGYQIVSTCYGSNTEYCTKSGTSMASPTAAGVAALVWSYASHLSRNEMRTVLQESAIDRGANGRDSVYGYGIPDTDAAIARAKPIYPDASFTSACSVATCVFDGSASSDGDGNLVSWSWDFGDGTGAATSIVSHEYTVSGTYTVTLTVTDNHDFTDTATDTVTVDVPPPPKSPPMYPPQDPEVQDAKNDLIADQVPVPHMDIEAVWFDEDVARLYVGMKLGNVIIDRTMAQVAYRVYFTPTWTMVDPTLGGVVPGGHEVLRFEVRAHYSPVGLPVYQTMTHELWVETRDPITFGSTWRQVTNIDGSLSTATDIMWWTFDRIDIGSPADGDTLILPNAVASPAVRGSLNTFGVTGDSTGNGRPFTF